MVLRRAIFNILVAASLCVLPQVSAAQSAESDARVDELLDRLADPELRNWTVTEREIVMLWSRSGSPTADYLLRRGRAAMADGDLVAAYDHFTALTDHAPEFAEGWNARATMFFRSQRFGPSIADIQRVLALEPRHFGALTGLGIMLEEMGLYERARDAFELAHDVNPHRPDIRDALDRIEAELEGQTL